MIKSATTQIAQDVLKTSILRPFYVWTSTAWFVKMDVQKTYFTDVLETSFSGRFKNVFCSRFKDSHVWSVSKRFSECGMK